MSCFHITACPAGTYLSPSNGSCSDCPANSVSEEEGLTQCTCVEGYYRATQGEDSPCTCMKIAEVYYNYCNIHLSVQDLRHIMQHLVKFISLLNKGYTAIHQNQNY